MSRIWFTADSHFGHANIIKLCNRPFQDIREHDEDLIARWNAVVRPDDILWHLGDCCYRSAKAPSSYLSRLHGRKHLVRGNHDVHQISSAAGWESIQEMAHIKVDDRRITLCHYAMRVWPASHHGSLHLYGHSHGRLPGDRQSLDVGVDCWDFYPVGMEQILERMQTLPERGLQ